MIHGADVKNLIHMKVSVKNVERGVERGNWRSWVTIMYLPGVVFVINIIVHIYIHMIKCLRI